MENRTNEANFFWSGELSLYEIANFRSFKHSGFKVNIWTYFEENKKIGELNEFNLMDANRIIDISMLNKFTQGNQKKNMSSFSNIFRFELLKKYGGWWFDADCICLKNVSDFQSLVKDKEFVIGREYKDYTGSSVLFFNNTNILDVIIKEAWARIEEKNYNFYWGEIGPNLISEIFLREDLMKKTLNEDYFYKIPADKFYLLFENKSNQLDIDNLIKDSYVCHYWNEMVNRALIRKDKFPPKNSYMFNHLKTYNQDAKNYKVYNQLFYIRFISSLDIFLRFIYRLKVLFNNFQKK